MTWTRDGWAEEALRRSAEALRNAGPGERHTSIYRSAADVAPYVRAGHIGAELVVSSIVAAAIDIGKGAHEADRTARDALARCGDAEPWFPDSVRDGDGTPRAVPALRIATPPPLAEVRAPDLSGIELPAVAPVGGEVEIVRFSGATTLQGTVDTRTWGDLAELMQDPMSWPANGKAGLPLWSPAVFRDGSRKKGEAVVERLDLIALDYDDDDGFGQEACMRWWGEVRHIVHTSASHLVAKATSGGNTKPARPRGRVLLGLSRSISWDEHCEIVPWLLQCGRGTPGAPELRSQGRCYYAPAEGPGGWWSYAHDPGAVIDVDALLSSIRSAVDEDEPAEDAVGTPGQPYIVKVQGGPAGWFLLHRRGYVPIDGELLRLELERAWPALVTSIPTEKGSRPMSKGDVWGTYGQRADALVYSMVDTTEGYEQDLGTGGGTLTIQVCREDPRLVPVYDEQVAEWLSRLVGAQTDRLLDWLACALDLAHPTAALYLEGKSGAGKGMLASALGRCYGRSTVDYKDVIGGFNSALKRSPIVYLDERAPKSPNGSAGFRSLVGDSMRALTEKYQPTATLVGCPRLIVAANNADALRLSEEDLERADEEAIAIRILHLQVENDCPAWLGEQGGRLGLTSEWVERADGSPGALCAHIAWLRDHWKVKRRGKRFLVEGDADRWLRSMGQREGLPRRVLAAVAAAASGKDRDWDEAEWPVLYEHGCGLVRPAELARHWVHLTGEGRAPSTTALGQALGRLGGERERVSRDWGRPWCRRVDARQVVEVARDLGVGDESRILARFGLSECDV